MTRTIIESILSKIPHRRASLRPRLTQNPIAQLARRPYFLSQCDRDDAK
jgi:hypothetical protein